MKNTKLDLLIERWQKNAGLLKENFSNDNEEEKQMAFSVLSDTYKEKNGFRPRGVYDYNSMSLEDINNEIERLSNTYEPFNDNEEEHIYGPIDGPITRHDHDYLQKQDQDDEYQNLGQDDEIDFLPKHSSIKSKFAKKHKDTKSIKEEDSPQLNSNLEDAVYKFEDLIAYEKQDSLESISYQKDKLESLNKIQKLIDNGDPWNAALIYKEKHKVPSNLSKFLDLIIKELG